MSEAMTSELGDGPGSGVRELPVDLFELEVITNRPDPRMGDRELADDDAV